MGDKRDMRAELLSIVRYAYASGWRDGNSRERAAGEMLYAESESRAIDYVTAREQNERHPLAMILATLPDPTEGG